MKKKVALVYGGDSSEFEVSVNSAMHLLEHFDDSKYDVYRVIIKGSDWRVITIDNKEAKIDKSDFSFLEAQQDGLTFNRVKFDKVLIMIHGTPGENGLLQAYFEMVGVDFISCSSTVSAITFDKYACKCFLRDTKISLAKEIFLRKGDEYNCIDIVEKLGLSLFVKPNNGGSSFGITKVKEVSQLEDAIQLAFTQDSSILIEEFIEGREMTNGVFQIGDKLTSLPVTEIVSHNEFFDYNAKYLGESNEICPAQIADELRDRIKATSQKIYKYLGCRGVVRIDYIVKNQEIYFLEINTIPGMTKMSLVPQQLREAGYTIKDFLTMLLG